MKVFLISIFLLAQIALSLDYYRDKRIKFEIVSANSIVHKGDTLHFAVKATLAKGWHIYWLNPGDAGEPTILELKTNVPNYTQIIPTYPPPFAKIENDILTLEYRDVAYFPFELVLPKDFSQSIEIELNAKWLVCRGKCIPGKAKFKKVFPLGKKLAKNQVDTKLSKAFNIISPDTIFANIYFNDESASLIFSTPNEKNLISLFFYPKNEGLFDLQVHPKFAVDGQHTILTLKMLQYTWGERENIEGILEVLALDKSKKYFHVKVVN